jgi:hypothetical protein
MGWTCRNHGLCKKYTYFFSWENLKERYFLEFLHAGTTIIVKWILRKFDVKIRIGFRRLREGLL